MEDKKLVREEVTIASVNAINMYPSIKLATIKNSVRFFARTLTMATKKLSIYAWSSYALE